MENLTAEQIKALIASALATAMDTPDGRKISALALRGVLNTMVDFDSQTKATQEAIMSIAEQALGIAQANALKNTAQDSAIGDANTLATSADTLSKANEARIATLEMGDGGGILTPEQIEAARLAREANTQFAIDQALRNTEFTNAIADLVRTQGLQDTAIQTAQTRADDANTIAVRAEGKADANAGVNAQLRTDVDTLQNAPPVDSLSDEQKENIAKIPNIVEQIGTDGAVGEQGTGLKGDVKALKATDDEIKDRLDEIGDGTFDVSDLETAHGITDDFAPGTAYRGTNDQTIFDNGAGAFVLHRATGEFVIPAITLTADDGMDLPAGTPVKLSNAYLNPGLTGTTVGFNPIMYYVIEQGTNRLVGRGAVGSAGTDQEVARDWAVADSVDSFTELNLDTGVTGTDIIVRWIAIYNGEDATLVPRLSHFNISFVGQYVAPIVDIVNNNTGDIRNDITDLKNKDKLLEGGIAANAVGVNRVEGKADSNTARINAVTTKLAQPQFEAIDEATVIPVDTETLDATTLNNTLGGGSPFAKQLDGAIDTATKFTTVFDQPAHILSIGGGQLARVLAGRLTIFELIEEEDARTDTSEVRYITTPQGLGSRNRPAVLEFGVAVAGQTARNAQDGEVYLDTGIPTAEANQTISNISMAFAIRTNGNWNGISETLQFSIRSGETRSFPMPSPIVEMTFTATALPGGRIRCRTTHNRGVGNSQEVVTNGGAIRFDAGYTIDTAVARIPRGQRGVDVGAYTGTEVITVDTIQAGDSDTLTVMVITADRTFNTGYFLSESARTSFGTENSQFTIFETETGIAVTPNVVGQLDGTDPYLGLFERTNHHADAFQFASAVNVPTSDGTMTYNVGDTLKRLEDIPTGTGLSETKARELATEVINNSPVIQANTAKPTEAVIDQKIATAVGEIELTPGAKGDKGDKGDPGTDGAMGAQGLRGEKGEPGTDGQDGAMGLQGLQGIAGQDGQDGTPGTPGRDGTDGAMGARGEQGIQGEMGLQGIQGEKGDKGDQGERGLQGDPGTAANSLTETRARELADEQIGSSTAVQANTAKVGITQDQATDIIRNNNKISFRPEDSAKLDAVIASASGHDTIFGTRLVGDWESGEELVFAPGITTLNLGDLVTQDGALYEALEAGLDNQTTVDAPDANPSAWRVYKIQTMPYDDTGIKEIINDIELTPGPKGDQGATGMDGAQGPRGIQGEPGQNGVDGVNGVDGAIGPQGVQGEKGDKGDRGDPGPVGDGGTAGVVGPKGDPGEQGIQGIQGIQGERGEIGPRGEQGQTGAMGTAGVDGMDGAQGPKGDTGTIQDTEGNPIVRFSDNANYVGSHPDFGGGIRFETFTAELTGAEINAGAKPVTVPTGNNVVYEGWSARVLTASTTTASISLRGGINATEGGNETLDLAVENATVEHAFGIGRDTQTNNITILSTTGAVSDETVLLISITVSQAVPLGEFPPEVSTTGAKGDQGETGEQGIQGNAGIQGAQGEMGNPGIQGEKGDTGATGAQGIRGEQGEQGVPGNTGAQGIQGETGARGAMGLQGQMGLPGMDGANGQDGAPGSNGMNGADGLPGARGERGLQGVAGEQGIRGEPGTPGIQGNTGEQGLQGNPGARGEKGDPGNQGIQGERGAIGPMGETGLQGIQGEKGEKGDPGTGAGGAMASDIEEGNAMQIELDGTSTGNFTIDLPTDSLTEDSAFNATLRITSAGGSAPDSYTYRTRYSDGAKEDIFGSSTATATQAGQGISLGEYTITAGRPIEIVVSANGAVGATQTWNLQANIGSGENGVLVAGAIALIEKYSTDTELDASLLKAPDLCNISGTTTFENSVGLNVDISCGDDNVPTEGMSFLDGLLTVETANILTGDVTIRASNSARQVTVEATLVEGKGTNRLVFRLGNVIPPNLGLSYDFADPITRLVVIASGGGISTAIYEGRVANPATAGAFYQPDVDNARSVVTEALDNAVFINEIARTGRGTTNRIPFVNAPGPEVITPLTFPDIGQFENYRLSGTYGSVGTRRSSIRVFYSDNDEVIFPATEYQNVSDLDIDFGAVDVTRPVSLGLTYISRDGSESQIGFFPLELLVIGQSKGALYDTDIANARKAATQIVGELDLQNEDDVKAIIASTDLGEGIVGPRGEKGDTGERGERGLEGLQGATGAMGLPGLDSTVPGPKGDQGIQGIQGEKGEKGDTGATGLQGEKGDTGERGANGTNGTDGRDSTVPGPQGARGERGEQGVPGNDGAQGVQGNPGVQGEQGLPGQDSTVPGPRGLQGEPGARGDRGIQGETGVQGIQGVPGQDSTVPGPRGIQGETGLQGIQGNTGEKGDKGDTGARGATGPAGATGAKGDQGIQGATGSQGPRGLQGTLSFNEIVQEINAPAPGQVVGFSFPRTSLTSTPEIIPKPDSLRQGLTYLIRFSGRFQSIRVDTAIFRTTIRYTDNGEVIFRRDTPSSSPTNNETFVFNLETPFIDISRPVEVDFDAFRADGVTANSLAFDRSTWDWVRDETPNSALHNAITQAAGAPNGNLTIPSGGNLNIASGGDIEVLNGGDINVTSGGNINIASGADIEVANGGNINLASGAYVHAPAHPSFRLVGTSGSYTHNRWSALLLSTSESTNGAFDQGNNVSGGVFTAPTNGIYHFSVMTAVQGTNVVQILAGISINDSSSTGEADAGYLSAWQGNTTLACVQWSGTVRLTAGQTVRARIRAQGTSVATNNVVLNSFSGHLVSGT